MAEYRYVGNAPQEVEKGDKRIMLGPGDFVKFEKNEAEAESVQALIESGSLIEGKEASK